MPATLQRQRKRRVKASLLTAPGILRFLGVPFKTSGSARSRGLQGFWSRNVGELDYLFKDAQSAYRAKAKQLHPDYGGSLKAMAELNYAFSRLERLFRQKLGLAPLINEPRVRIRDYKEEYKRRDQDHKAKYQRKLELDRERGIVHLTLHERNVKGLKARLESLRAKREKGIIK